MFFYWILARLSEFCDESHMIAIDSHNISVVKRSVEGIAASEKMFRSGNLSGENMIGAVEMIVEFKGASERFRLDDAEGKIKEVVRESWKLIFKKALGKLWKYQQKKPCTYAECDLKT